MALNPTSVRAPIPLLPEEFDEFHDAYQVVGDATQSLKAYGKQFPDTYAGVISEGRTAIALFSSDIEQHRLALESLLDPGVPFEVQERPWSLAQLDAFARGVEADRQWFNDRGFQLFDADVSPGENVVVVRYMGPVATDPKPSEVLESGIVDEFGPWAVPEWAGPIPWEGARGSLRVRVVGDVPRESYCHTVPTDPTAGEGNASMPPDRRGTCRMSGLPVGVYEVSLTTTTDERALLSNVVTVRVREGEWTDVRLTVR